MEGRVTFSVWGEALRRNTEEQLRLLSHWRGLSRGDALKLITVSRAQGKPLLMAFDISWDRALEIAEEGNAFFQEPCRFQAGYAPHDIPQLQHCELHGLWYASCLGCPVCLGHNA